MRNLKPLLLSVCFVLGCFASAAAQYDDTGKLDTWTTTKVARLNYTVGGLRAVRTARHDGFDRVVLEFADGVPSFSLSYARLPVHDAVANAPAKIFGTAVIEIALVAYYDQKDREAIHQVYPKGELDLPVLREIKLTKFNFYKAEAVFALGLQGRKGFRVQMLNNPARLLIDLKG